MVSRRIPRSKQQVVPALFDIPEGLDDLVYAKSLGDGDDTNEDESLPDVEDTEAGQKKPKKKKKKKKKKVAKKKKKKDKKTKAGSSQPVNTPDSLVVVKQVIRTKKDGSQVVDLTIDVDRINRADKYEFRVTKKDTGKTTVIEG